MIHIFLDEPKNIHVTTALATRGYKGDEISP